MDKTEEIKIRRKCKRNKTSLLLLSFYSGISTISELGVKYYLKEQTKTNTAIFTKILLLFKISYLIKPLYGLLIDFIPIFGYKNKVYLYICFLINLFCWIIFIYQDNINIYIPIICLIFISISQSFTSVITSAIQVEISKLQDKQNTISKGTSDLMANFFIIKTFGTLIPSYLKGILIEKYSYNIIFYLSSFFSGFILISGIILDDEKIIRKIKTKKSFPHLIDSKKREIIKSRIVNLIQNKNILILFLLIFILESSPTGSSTLFFYETNILKLNPKKLGLIDFISQISIILLAYFYRYFL